MKIKRSKKFWLDSARSEGDSSVSCGGLGGDPIVPYECKACGLNVVESPKTDLPSAESVFSALRTMTPMCSRTLAAWGARSQTAIAMEEMGELITVLNHFERGRVSRLEVTEEIADVLMTVLQLAALHGYDDVARDIGAKTERLRGRLVKAEKEHDDDH